MKKFIIPVLALLALASCTAKFDEMNKPDTGLTFDVAQPMYIFGRTLYNGSSNDHQRNFNLNDDMYAHYFAQGLGWTDFWRYNAGWGDIFWRDFYTERLQEYWLIEDLCANREDYSCIKACNDIWNVVLWLRVIDRYGDAPYFDENGVFAAGKGTTLPYSKVTDIYADLIKRLKNDVPLLGKGGNQVTFSSYDFLFQNDWNQWKKFANTLIMRLSMRMSGLGDTYKADFAAAANGCFDNPKDYARISCDTGVWGDYYDRTFNDWSNTFTNCDFVSMLSGVNRGYAIGVVDPRRAFFFKEGTRPSWEKYLQSIQDQIDKEKAEDEPNADKIKKLQEKLDALKKKGGYDGTTWDGYPFDYTADTEEGIVDGHGGSKSFAGLNMYDVNGLFHYSGKGNENLAWCYGSYSEALFLKAEGALRGWISGSAQDLWKQAIKASMDEIGEFVTRSGGKEKISASAQNAYIAALPSFGSSKEDQLRSIMIQKWIALYPNSVEAWAEQRRTGYPDYASHVLTYPAVSASSGVSVGNIIQRIPYPQNEYNTNAVNIPEDHKDYNAKNMEKGIFWSLKGEGGTQSATAAPKNF